jgi:hypothetical protein
VQFSCFNNNKPAWFLLDYIIEVVCELFYFLNRLSTLTNTFWRLKFVVDADEIIDCAIQVILDLVNVNDRLVLKFILVSRYVSCLEERVIVDQLYHLSNFTAYVFFHAYKYQNIEPLLIAAILYLNDDAKFHLDSVLLLYSN